MRNRGRSRSLWYDVETSTQEIKTVAYIRKTVDVWSIQQYCSSRWGWEEVTQETTRKDAIQTRDLYRANQPEYPVKFVKQREKKV